MAKKKGDGAAADLDGKAAFIKVAAMRVNRAASVLRSIGSLGHIARYEYTADQAKKISDFLTKEVAELHEKLQARFIKGAEPAAVAGFSFETTAKQ